MGKTERFKSVMSILAHIVLRRGLQQSKKEEEPSVWVDNKLEGCHFSACLCCSCSQLTSQLYFAKQSRVQLLIKKYNHNKQLCRQTKYGHFSLQHDELLLFLCQSNRVRIFFLFVCFFKFLSLKMNGSEHMCWGTSLNESHPSHVLLSCNYHDIWHGTNYTNELINNGSQCVN